MVLVDGQPNLSLSWYVLGGTFVVTLCCDTLQHITTSITTFDFYLVDPIGDLLDGLCHQPCSELQAFPLTTPSIDDLER